MIFIIYPIHLYNNINLEKYDQVYIVEEPLYFTEYKYNKIKLIYHRATMKKYYDKLNHSNLYYINYDNVDEFYIKIKNKEIYCYDPIDYILEKKLKKIFNNITLLETPNFLIKNNEINNIKNLIYKGHRYNHDLFYKYQRMKLNILMDENNKPINGKWTFDNLNRNPLPKTYNNNTNYKIQNNKYINEAKEYINKNFKNNYGYTDNIIFPIDRKESIKWLKRFLETRLNKFGKYQDAIHDQDHIIYHSVLSPMMNIGLITDTDVIKISEDYYKKNKKNILIENYEGFIRQIIGWRNYVYLIYKLEYNKEYNYLNHNNKIPYYKFWEGKTNIEPIDNTINKIKKYGYVHHIERLMILGNFMLLLMIHPKDVYKMFMEWTIDAYNWVMYPNVYYMSQYSDGGNMMSRPYFSSSNYVIKMSNYKKGDWCKIWDALYYNFINKHENILKNNYSYAIHVKNYNKKSDEDKKEIKKIVKKYNNDLKINSYIILRNE
jgi:deoxyribodipyrimidine photolyase-related protein